jgi:hypothetical protein
MNFIEENYNRKTCYRWKCRGFHGRGEYALICWGVIMKAFVDVVTTMEDESIPLTTVSLMKGNQRPGIVYVYAGDSPCDQVKPQTIPIW